MIKNGISEENLNKLFTHAQIHPKEQEMVRNLSYLGVNVIADVSRKAISWNWKLYNFIFVHSTIGEPQETISSATQKPCHRSNVSNVPLDASAQRYHGRLYRRQIGLASFPIFGGPRTERHISCTDQCTLRSLAQGQGNGRHQKCAAFNCFHCGRH